jgi:hypothetical protein
MSKKNFFVCFMFFSAVDTIGPIFILIFFFYVYCHFSAISAPIPLRFPAVSNFFSTTIFELFCGIFRYLATVQVTSYSSKCVLWLIYLTLVPAPPCHNWNSENIRDACIEVWWVSWEGGNELTLESGRSTAVCLERRFVTWRCGGTQQSGGHQICWIWFCALGESKEWNCALLLCAGKENLLRHYLQTQ